MPARHETEGSPRYWAWLYSPPRPRAVLEALLAVEDEIRAALQSGLDHHVAHVRLEWWREECSRYAGGMPAHPLMRTLLAACAVTPPETAASSSASRPDPGGLIDTAAWDLASATFATRAELTGYCDRWASAVTEIAAEGAVVEPQSEGGPECAREHAARFGRCLGTALEEIELLIQLAGDARLGRLRLPLDELEQRGVGPSALAHPPWPPALCDLLRARQQASRAALAASVAALPPRLQPPLRGLIVWAQVAHGRSLRAERALPHAWQPRGTSRLADAWLGWRAARRADRRKFHLTSGSFDAR